MAKEWWEDAPVVGGAEASDSDWWAAAPLADEPPKKRTWGEAITDTGKKIASGVSAVGDELGRLRDEVFTGVDNTKASAVTVNTAAQAAQLQKTNDRLAELMSYGEGDSPEAQGLRKTADFYAKRMPRMVGDMTEAQADAQRGSAMTTRPAVAEMGAAKTFGEAWEIFKKNPYDVIAGVTATSLPGTVPALIVGAAMGPTAGAVAMGGSSAITEAGSSIADFARESGVDTTDRKAVEAFFANRENLAEAMSYAGKRAGIIGSLDAASGGIAGKTLAPAFKSGIARQAVNVPTQMAVQAGAGAGGEAGAQLATKGRIDQPGQVLMEAAGELGGAPSEIAAFSKDARDAILNRGTTAKADPVQTILKAESIDDAITAAMDSTAEEPAPSTAIQDSGRAWQELGILASGETSSIAARQAGQGWQDIAPEQTGSLDAQRAAIERAGAQASAARDARLADVGQQWQDLGITNPQDDLQAQRAGMRGEPTAMQLAMQRAQEKADVSPAPDLQRPVAASSGSGGIDTPASLGNGIDAGERLGTDPAGFGNGGVVDAGVRTTVDAAGPLNFSFTKNASGTVLVDGDPAAIRAAFPDAQGMVKYTDGQPSGVLFSTRSSPSVLAQLETPRVQNPAQRTNPETTQAAPAQAPAAARPDAGGQPAARATPGAGALAADGVKPSIGGWDYISGLEKDAGSGFKTNDDGIALIRAASNGMTPAAKAAVTRTINKFSSIQKDGTRLIKPGFYDAVSEKFAYTEYMLSDAIKAAVAQPKPIDPRLIPVSKRGKEQNQPLAPVQTAPTATETVADAGPLGRNNVPLSEGGKPYKTKLSADTARKNQPAMRVKRVEGGYVLVEKTPAQLAAQEKAAKRLSQPRTSPNGEPIPAHSMIAAAGGLSKEVMADMGMGDNPKVGNRRLFAAAGGLTIEQATEKLVEDGYLQEGASHSQAMDLIKRSLTNPQYTPEGTERMAEKEMQEREAAFNAEQEALALAQEADDTAYDLAVKAFEETMLNEPQGLAQGDMSLEDALLVAGFTEQELKNDTADQQADVGGGIARAENASAEANQSPAEAEAGGGAQDPQGRDGAAGQDQGSGEGFDLTAPTREDVLAQKERADAAAKEQARADKEAADKAKADADVGEFTLTGSDRAADVGAAGGQTDIFGAAAEPEAKPKSEEDDWMKLLFGNAPTQPESKESPSLNAPALRGIIADLAKDLKTQRDDWAARKYKGNAKQINLRGDGPSNQESLSVSTINEGRRTKAIQAFDDQLKQLGRLDAQIESDAGANEFLNLVKSTWEKAQAFKPQSPDQLSGAALFESLMIDALKLQPANGSYTSLPITKALRAMMEDIQQQPDPKPAAEMSVQELLRAAADKMDAVKPETKPATEKNVIEAESDLWSKISDGTATLDEFKAGFENWVSRKEEIQAQLSKKTKPQLLEVLGGFMAQRYKSENKPEVVQAVWREGLSAYALARSYPYGMGKDAMTNGIRRMVENTDADQLAQYASDRKAAQEESVARAGKAAEAIKDPKTLDDYRTWMRATMSGGKSFKDARMQLTAEQRAQYDAMAGEETRSKRKDAKEARQESAMRAPGAALTASEIIKTKHTKQGHDLWQFELGERVSSEEFKALVSKAKMLNGTYSSYRGGGAIPGWQFRNEEAARAFRALVTGDNAKAKELMQTSRDAYADDRSQSAAERLTEMADRLEEQSDASLNQDRKTNTNKRASQAASAEAAANADKAMAKTMRNIATAISDGTAKFLDRVRQKTQVAMLQGFVKTAKDVELRAKYESYGEQERHKGEPPTGETADFAEFPYFTAYRSDLATLARQLLDVDGTKLLGQKLLKEADDVSDAYLKFSKENLGKVSIFRTKEGGLAGFGTKSAAEDSIARSGYKGKAIAYQVKRGEYTVIASPTEAVERGIWNGDGDKRITLTPEIGNELVEKIGKAARRGAKVSVPWQLETAHDRQKALSRMGIETPAEFRAALREFIGLQEQAAAPNKVKELERSMVGRKNDGMDFFPTPESVADEMVSTADIQPGMAVLEPSAGWGHIAERIRAAGVDPDVGEMSSDRRELLEAKGFNVVGRDFMELNPREFYMFGDTFKAADGTEGVMRGSGGLGSNRVRLLEANGNVSFHNRDDLTGIKKNGAESGYDRILMNPPFSDGRDIQHVQHAYTLLKPGGRIVAIMGESAFTNQNKRATEFREWLESVGGTDEKLPEGSFNDPTLPVNTGANARMVVIDKTDKGAAMFSRATSEDSPGLEAFAKADDLFALPLSDAKDLEQIARDNGAEVKIRTTNLGVEKLHTLTFEDGTVIRITDRPASQYGQDEQIYAMELEDGNSTVTQKGRPGENPEDVPPTDDVWLDVSENTPAKWGATAYSIAMTYALNNDKIFIGDPNGLTGKALRRRTEQMLSHALKSGTTRHMAPHPKQVAGDSALGVPPLKWIYGDHVGNMERMIDVSLESLENGAPGAKDDTRYNPDTGEFTDKSGKVVPRKSAMGRDMAAYRAGVNEAQAGWRTLARAAFLRSFLGPNGRAEGSGILDRAGGNVARLASRGLGEGNYPASERVFYSEGKRPVVRNPSTVARVQAAVAELIGSKQLPNSLGRVVATTAAEIKSTWEPLIDKSVNIGSEGDAGVAQAFYDPLTKTVFLIADHISQGNEIAVLAHELMHKHGQDVLGKDGWDRMHSVIGTWKNAEPGSQENAVYQYAISKVKAVGLKLSNQELFPYAVEAAFKMGIKPSMAAKAGSVARWLESVRQNMKMVWAKITGKPETFKTQDLVDLAYGIAQRENPEYAMEDFKTAKPDQTETEAFRKWFGDSKVVDAAGKPLVVYHGTRSDIQSVDMGKTERLSGFWMTPDPKLASTYAANGLVNPSSYPSGSNVMPLYAKIEKPYIFDPKKKGFQWAWDEYIAGDYDGLIEHGNDSKGVTTLVVKSASQIKSATGNNGQFDGTNPDINFSRAPSSPHSWNSPEPSRFDDLVYKLQDKQVDTRRVIEEIRNTGKALADEKDVYLQEELFHGRAAARTEDFVNNELSPLITEMKMRGIDIATLDEYLHARHAQEANELIAERNPDIQDGGSGMTTKAARDYLAKLDPAERKRLEAVAAKVDAILGKTRQMYADYNLESQATVNGWGQMFKNYVPLMREDKDGTGMGIGQGFSIKGKETKGRTGSTRKVVDILANIAMQRERAIVRGEKNRVATALVGLAELNPNEEFWAVGPPPTEKVYDPKSNTVVDRADPLFKSRENVVVAKVKEPSGEVVEKAVRFNEDNERAVRMAVALKNLDAAQLNGLLGVSAKISRYFAAINTQYNPIFGVVNLVRDVQGAILNLTTTPLKDKKAEIAGHTLAALKGVYLDARAAREGKPQTSAWAKLWEDFQNEGGQTGYRDMFANSNDRAKAIEYELNPTKWMDSPLGKVFTANGTLKVPLEVAQKKAEGLFGWLSDYNLAMENGVRLSAYKVGLEQGMSKQQAASLAKNLTVNFNRKGQVGQQAGAVYAFFNASMQGTARIGQTLFDMDGSDPKTIRLSPTGKKIVYGGILLGVIQSLTLAAAGFDDEEPPEFVRERSLIIPTGGKTYITIPMPLGLHVLPNMGRIPTEFVLGGFKQPVKSVVKLLGLTAGAFNPIGGGASLTQMLAPTAVDPLVALAENKDWTGKPIAKTSYNKATPGFALTKDTASAPSKVLAEAINTMSGGTKYTAGVLSPTPDQIDYLWGQVTGGVGRELSKAQQSASAMVSGEDLPIHKIPLLGRFYGDADTQSAQSSKFYSTINRLNEHEAEIKGLRKDRKAADLAEYMRDNPDARMFETANKVELEVQKMRRMKRELIALDAPPERIKALEERITQTMTRFNERAAAFKKRESREAEAAQ